MLIAVPIEARDEYIRRAMLGNEKLVNGDRTGAMLEHACASAFLDGVRHVNPDCVGLICCDADMVAGENYGDRSMTAGQLHESQESL